MQHSMFQGNNVLSIHSKSRHRKMHFSIFESKERIILWSRIMANVCHNNVIIQEKSFGLRNMRRWDFEKDYWCLVTSFYLLTYVFM